MMGTDSGSSLSSSTNNIAYQYAIYTSATDSEFHCPGRELGLAVVNPEPPTSMPTLAPTATPATGAICFTGDSLLTLKDGSSVRFHDLQVSE